MKIKTTKKLNLAELIQFVWENEVFPSVWRSEESPTDDWTITFFEDGMFRSRKGFHDYDTFIVEVEEELTEHTYLKHLMEVTKDNLFEERVGMTIEGAVRPNTSALYIIEGGAFHLIWSRESGIPEAGVLEVDAE